ncbi:nucleotidyl transferase AbiEii/AbiGii toxin family protein [Candidatus Nephthysia bennettiae]|uniref:Nucleotidyl transferase AbiEii/AbiGii toxin family protein n=1 Tax=Candidatus Nephthysia bennettiae TaxID=3127016 RepID=A0A934K1U8_9BACT|nr:nucleotidyl transferase AbiEii/AbiGii toxin family protein [Candidatus Dormibacteraeota bacterium]
MARLQQSAPDRWVLKGGFALELRLGGQARTTRDIDLDWRTTLHDPTEVLLEAASLDLHDYFDFDVERAGEADLLGAVRYRANASIAGRLFEQLLIDIGIDQAHFEPAEELTTPDLLGFAGIEPVRIPAAPLEQHLAEKLHAYTRRYGPGHASSRPKDLIDMVLISELADFQAQRLRQVVEGVFSTRTTHELPTRFPPPSSQWARPYRILATEVGVDPDPRHGHGQVARLLDPLLAGISEEHRWDREALVWRPP